MSVALTRLVDDEEQFLGMYQDIEQAVGVAAEDIRLLYSKLWLPKVSWVKHMPVVMGTIHPHTMVKVWVYLQPEGKPHITEEYRIHCG